VGVIVPKHAAVERREIRQRHGREKENGDS
jgi:hypothetical protein